MRSTLQTWTFRIAAGAAALPLAAAPASGHPARGIVVAPNGTVYFSDLERIWSIAPSGRLKLVREHRDIHTHALALARDGSVYGEDSEYRPASQSYLESIWRISPSGRFAYTYGPTDRLQRGVGLQRDAHGCSYHADQTGQDGRPLVHSKCPGRPPQRLVGTAADDRAFRPVLANDVAGTALAGGNFYFRQGRAVHKIAANGRVSLVADGLEPGNFGLAVDPRGNVYVAEHMARRIVRVSPDHRRTTVATSGAPWLPTGVTLHAGAIYLLEATEYRRGVETRMRVRRLGSGPAVTLATVTIPLD